MQQVQLERLGRKASVMSSCAKVLGKGSQRRKWKKDKLELYEIAETQTELGEALRASLTSTLETARSETGIAFIY